MFSVLCVSLFTERESDHEASLGVKNGYYAVSSSHFLVFNQDYRYKSVFAQIPHDAGWHISPLPGIKPGIAEYEVRTSLLCYIPVN